MTFDDNFLTKSPSYGLESNDKIYISNSMSIYSRYELIIFLSSEQLIRQSYCFMFSVTTHIFYNRTSEFHLRLAGLDFFKV